MRPNYLVIGAQKCATSSLCALLGEHPDVFMTTPKEPYFFSSPAIWVKGWSWYESLFDDAGDCRAVGEGSTTYTQNGLYPEAPARIARHLPHARLIYIVRDPLERMKSHWMHLRSRENNETRSFNIAIRERPEYLDNSRYCRQIDWYRAHFSDDQILVLFFEDFRRDPRAVLRCCFEFLQVDPSVEIEGVTAARHASSSLRVDRPILTPLRRLPFFREIRDAVPDRLRHGLWRVFKRPIDPRPEWDEDVRRWAIGQLLDDSRAFLERYRPRDGWWRWVVPAAAR